MTQDELHRQIEHLPLHVRVYIMALERQNRHLRRVNPMIVTDPTVNHRYITTLTGVNIGPPGVFNEGNVRIADITRSLSMTARFYGHLDRFYSVAEHSMLVAQIATALGDEAAVTPALLHDAHEAYMGDIASPQKHMIAGAHEFERQMEGVVRRAFRLPPPNDPVWARVRQYDLAILHREIATLREVLPDWYDHKMEALVPGEVQPIGLEWRDAERLFRAALRDRGISFE